ncbi:LytTR family DNA-binding domain-containing protein [Flavobacterium sp. A45]|uniref:LytTR family DNA-binding domain-containing protein n=1 Tax=Flavobacterium sp. A45 TaxID=1945862 RepID=UPI0009845289|nr:LytTR family DNA-binding domain-containing protein [Flavobacterium sp. A45]OOG68966.1 hypothetical protein B0E44_12180 [Flavobacterium sp. A45]
MNQKKLLLNFLKQPYPFYYEGKKLLQITAVFFLISFFFNYMLQPFDVNPQEQKMHYFWICCIHSFSPIFVLLCIALICKLFPKATDDWKIKNECILVFFLLLFTGITQFLIRDVIYDNPMNWSWRYFIEEISNTFIAGIFLAPIIISINLNRQQLKNSQKADRISSSITDVKKIQNNTTITIETEVKSEKFVFESHSFIYAKAEGNYAEIFLKKDDKVQKLIKRIPIKNLEMQLSTFPFIIKTHRSVLLNLNYIEKVTGNAQGYKVQLKDSSDTVPVSRNFIQSFETATASR